MKLSEPNSSSVVYLNDEQPYFVDVTGKGVIFPTIYADVTGKEEDVTGKGVLFPNLGGTSVW
eukprot:2323302-Rhodomonas_salina.1